MPVSRGPETSWGAVVRRLLLAARSGRPHPGLGAVLARVRDAGAESAGAWAAGVAAWVPGPAAAGTLREARDAMAAAANPTHGERVAAEARLRALLEAIDGPPGAGALLVRLALAHVASRAPAARAAAPPGRKARRPRPMPPLRVAQRRLEHTIIRHDVSRSFGAGAHELTICIDESWPGAQHGESRRGEGVIAGLVWLGSYPDPAVLPLVRDHLGVTSTAALSLKRVLELHERAFPFIMPIHVGTRGGGAQAHYDALVQTAVKLILGWLLRPARVAPGGPRRVRILLDQKAPQHPHEHDGTEYFRGMLADPRYAGWTIERVQWLDCARVDSYIPYADALAYLPLEHHDHLRQQARAARYREWPGYVPISLALAPMLDRLDALPELGNVEDVLDLAALLHGTALLAAVEDGVRAVLAERADLQQRLVERLVERYRVRKDRELAALAQQLAAVRRLVPSLPPDAGVRARLLWTALHLQDANAHGDPVRVRAAVEAHEAAREQALADDPELAVFCELNLAVTHADRFDFAAALACVRRVRDDPRFPFLPRVLRGRVLSSLGQVLALGGEHATAARQFDDAIALFSAAAVAENDRRRDVDQTAVYRAINALAARDPGAPGAVADVLGADLVAAAATLATSLGASRPYHHHLLLRALYDGVGSAAALVAYLDAQDRWPSGDQHPWELVGLYRALLLRRTGAAPGAVTRQLESAHRLATADGGATLRLIGAVVAVVASCCDAAADAWPARADECLAVAARDLPGAATAVRTLRAVLAGPSEAGIGAALAVLPFNYR